MIWIVLLIIAASLAVDHAAWRRFIAARFSSRRTARICLAALWATDLLPLITVLLYKLLPDNTTAVMSIMSWSMFAFLLLVVPRMAAFAVALASRRRWIRAAGIVIAAAIASVLIGGVTVWRTALEIKSVEIHSDKLPATFDGFRIAVFSDLHVGALLNPGRETEMVVSKLNSIDADLIVFCGDLVNIRYTELNARCLSALSKLSAPYGVLAVTGNHDTGIYIKNKAALSPDKNMQSLLDMQRYMGWHVLDDETIHIRRGSDSISISGISFGKSLFDIRHSRNIPDADLTDVYAGSSPDLYNITLSHLPQLWGQITGLGYGDLTISGHVHAMQAKAQLFGRKISPASLIYDNWSGLYGDSQTGYLYINDGIGYVGVPARFGARPEITLIILKQ